MRIGGKIMIINASQLKIYAKNPIEALNQFLHRRSFIANATK